MSATMPNRWRIDSALAFTTDSDNGNRFEVWAPSTVLRVLIGEQFQVHAEYFGQFSESRIIAAKMAQATKERSLAPNPAAQGICARFHFEAIRAGCQEPWSPGLPPR